MAGDEEPPPAARAQGWSRSSAPRSTAAAPSCSAASSTSPSRSEIVATDDAAWRRSACPGRRHRRCGSPRRASACARSRSPSSIATSACMRLHERRACSCSGATVAERARAAARPRRSRAALEVPASQLDPRERGADDHGLVAPQVGSSTASLDVLAGRVEVAAADIDLGEPQPQQPAPARARQRVQQLRRLVQHGLGAVEVVGQHQRARRARRASSRAPSGRRSRGSRGRRSRSARMCSWSPGFSARWARISVAAARVHGSGCSSVSARRCSAMSSVRPRTAARIGRASASSGRPSSVVLQPLGQRSRARRPAAVRGRRSSRSGDALADQPVDRVGLAGRSSSANSIQVFASSCAPESIQNHSSADREVQRAAAVAGVAEPAQRGDHVVVLGPAGGGTSRAARRVRSSGSAPSASAANQRAWARAGGLDLARLVELLERVLADRLEHPVARRRRPAAATVGQRGEAVERVRVAARPRPRTPRSRPRWKTASRRASARSSSSSRPQLQSTTARSVRWRGSAARLPPVSRRKRSSRRAASCSSGIVRSRAAASSIASGSPSRRRQISSTTASSSVEAGRGGAGAVDEQAAPRARRPAAGPARGSRPRSPAARGWWRRSAGPGSRPAAVGERRRRRRSGARSCRAARIVSRSTSASIRRSRPSRGVAPRRVEHGALAQAERGERGGDDLDLGGHRRELDHPDAVVDAVDPAAQRLAREPRLARAARADERDQPRGARAARRSARARPRGRRSS